eukprot:SAG11_NODE_5833_length_1453_cov_1.203840_1_plen_151_part_00
MFDRFGRGTISWDEIRIICGELAFPNLLPVMKDEAKKLLGLHRVDAEQAAHWVHEDLSLDQFQRLLRSQASHQALEAESQHHTASYQYKVLEKCLQVKRPQSLSALCETEEDWLHECRCLWQSISIFMKYPRHASRITTTLTCSTACPLK